MMSPVYTQVVVYAIESGYHLGRPLQFSLFLEDFTSEAHQLDTRESFAAYAWAVLPDVAKGTPTAGPGRVNVEGLAIRSEFRTVP